LISNGVEEDRQGRDIEEEIWMHMNIIGVHLRMISFEIQLPKSMHRQRYWDKKKTYFGDFGFLLV